MPRRSHRPASAAVAVLFTLCLFAAAGVAQLPVPAAKRPLSMEDLLSWKGIRSPTISNDGRWMAYILAPNEGDAEFVVRGTAAGEKETRIAIGEAPAAGFGAATNVAISGNNRWAAYTVYPKAEDAKKARKDRRTLPTKVGVIELATGTKREFDRVRSFRFAGDHSNLIALQLMPPDAPVGAAGASAAAPAAAGGSVVMLVDMTGGAPITLASVGEFAFDESGNQFAYTVDQRDQMGNGVQVRDMTTGVVRALDGEKALYRRLTWADSGDALAVVRSVADSVLKDTLSTVLGWAHVGSRTPTTVTINEKSAGVTANAVISADRAPKWNDAQTVLYFGLREPHPAPPPSTGAPLGGGSTAPAPGAGAGGQVAPARQDDETPSLILWHWKDPRLQSAQQVQESADKTFSWLAAWNMSAPKVVQLSDDNMRSVTVGVGARWALGTDMTPYERQASVDGRALRDLYAIDVMTGARSIIAKGVQNPSSGGFGGGASQVFAPDGQHAVWYDNGKWSVYDFTTKASRVITDGITANFWDDEDDHNVVKPPAAPPLGWSRDSRDVFLRDNWDLWRVPVNGGAAVNITGNGKSSGIRYQARVAVAPRERGIDVTKPMFIETYGERTKKEGLAMIDVMKGGARVMSWEDDKVDYRRARDADVWVYTRQTFVRFPDFYAADGGLANERRLTDANPQQSDVAWSAGARLIDYQCDNNGDRLQGALFLPAGYEPGKQYPTVTYI